MTAVSIRSMDVTGRWLPDGVRVERTADDRVRIVGGEHDGHIADSIAEVRAFARQAYRDPEVTTPDESE